MDVNYYSWIKRNSWSGFCFTSHIFISSRFISVFCMEVTSAQLWKSCYIALKVWYALWHSPQQNVAWKLCHLRGSFTLVKLNSTLLPYCFRFMTSTLINYYAFLRSSLPSNTLGTQKVDTIHSSPSLSYIFCLKMSGYATYTYHGTGRYLQRAIRDILPCLLCRLIVWTTI